MPESLVINLVSESIIPFHYLKGHYLQRLFLALVSAVDADLSQLLQTHKHQSFTLSPLQIASQPQSTSVRNLKFLLPRQQLETTPFQYANSSVPAGSHCWWRISLLDDSLFAHVSPRLKQAAAHKTWYLGSARLYITNFLPANGHEWASHSTYQQLYEQASDTNHDLMFQLLTPAVFRHGERVSPLPTRDAVFHSLRKCWNRYSGLVFAPDTILPITAHDFNLRTVTLSLGNNETVMGCLGDLTFQIANKTDPLIVKRINALTDFSCYCGIGYKTDLSLGMVRAQATSRLKL
ncbi:CRISPR system precrRNA processing endoribonuclease RAMP protein Cas6 [Leptothoe spongobia]|uniref:CRISPR system precrRNA processing endoribonuclease RAMP protein Cas6 n=1 Tax=Leptothoe spongobia TAU-MAC 1115 TaxID=1967444 RepID=A0A947DGH0_9CYAN|nr:CRISPR system precrRNA processing endoribonuclease RAMP protein Cas6 [Leptothoe spongobia]MBT9316320.1 CRISPR system precrRNA processing endoribonuclease RAMP protein Cas6 [Leptothoe spongobia TAU-MAC 1115]